MEKNSNVQEETLRLLSKLSRELETSGCSGMARGDTEDEEISPEIETDLTWNGKNLLAVQGCTFTEKAHRLAETLWTSEERQRVVIDPSRKKRATDKRDPADNDRNELFRNSMKRIMGEKFDKSSYRAILRLVNQTGLDAPKPPKSTRKEN